MTDLEHELAQLGGTADEIAAALIAKDMRGSRKSESCCPIATYLSVAFEELEVTENVISCNRGDTWLYTPEHVAQFIDRFDKGEWPELDIDRLVLG